MAREILFHQPGVGPAPPCSGNLESKPLDTREVLPFFNVENFTFLFSINSVRMWADMWNGK